MIHSVAEKARISLAYLKALLEPIGPETASKVFLIGGKFSCIDYIQLSRRRIECDKSESDYGIFS